MGKVTFLCIFLVLALLLEDGSSVRKRTEEEEKEDREIAEKVNATLAEEKKKEDEEKRRENEKKRKSVDQTKTEKEDKGKKMDVEDKDEACPPANSSCPTVEPCEDCPGPQSCPPCKRCPLLVECDPCLPMDCQPCPRGEDPVVNHTRRDVECPVPPACPGVSPSMTVPVAMAVGAVASLVVTGAVAILGLLLRYAPPLISGFLFLFLVALTWYLSSHYPETARDLGGRVVATLREATVALGHRVVEAIQRHNEQVGFLTVPNLFFRIMSSMFHLKVCTKIFCVVEN
jgi:hypothetical protein